MKNGFNLNDFLRDNKIDLDENCLDKGEVLNILHDKLKDFSFVNKTGGHYILKKDNIEYQLSYESFEDKTEPSEIKLTCDNKDVMYGEVLNSVFRLTFKGDKIYLSSYSDSRKESFTKEELTIEGDKDNKSFTTRLYGVDRKKTAKGMYDFNMIRERNGLRPSYDFIPTNSDYCGIVLKGTSTVDSFDLSVFDMESEKELDSYSYDRNLPIYVTTQTYIKEKDMINELNEIVSNDFVRPSAVSFK